VSALLLEELESLPASYLVVRVVGIVSERGESPRRDHPARSSPSRDSLSPIARIAACTTNRLSYIPTDECRIPTKSFAPVHKYQPSDISMESETTMRLSYQPVEVTVPSEKTWVTAYHPPVDPMEDSTTYNLR